MDIKLIEIVKQLKKYDDQGYEFIDALPRPLDDFMIDNDYTNSLGCSISILLKSLFGDMHQDVVWFLYEWKPGNKNPQIWLADGTAIVVETEDQYYEYLAKHC